MYFFSYSLHYCWLTWNSFSNTLVCEVKSIFIQILALFHNENLAKLNTEINYLLEDIYFCIAAISYGQMLSQLARNSGHT